MPDDIAVNKDGQHMMAYQGATPWHRFGQQLEGRPNVEQALEAAHLKWEVECRSMFIAAPDCEPIEVPKRRAVVRTSDHQILGTVGMNYQPLQNSEAFSVLQAICEEFGVTIETAGALGRGERVWMLANLHDHAEVVDGDRVNAYVLILTGHDGATPNTGRLTNVRVVCANTLAVAVHGTPSMYRISHARQDKDALLANAKNLVANVTRQFRFSIDQARLLAQFKLNALETGRYIDKVLQIDNLELASNRIRQRRQMIVELAYRGKGVELAPETLWTAYNAFTEYVDHVLPATVSAGKRIQTNRNAIFGAGALLKARALEIALQVVKGTA